ncbi:MAG: diaminopimelate epimerase [Gemmatimonadota bacterium]
MRDLPFSKGHGLGNDYLVVDAADLPFEITPERVRALCDRHRGAGSDGLLVGTITDDAFRLRIYNPDGSEAEKSGNGLRIFGAWLYELGLVQQDWFDVELVKDKVAMRVEAELPGGALMIRALMGRANFEGSAAGFTRQPGEVLDYELELSQSGTARVNTVSLSNPHCVVFVQDFERADFLARAPQLCAHPAFAAGTNVQFARVLDDATVAAWIWERGVGETLASGSSSCAVAAAAVRRGFVQPGLITVQMLGGNAEVEVTDDYTVKLRAPAQMIFSGVVRGEVIAGW